jgi:hypothetical protein
MFGSGRILLPAIPIRRLATGLLVVVTSWRSSCDRTGSADPVRGSIWPWHRRCRQAVDDFHRAALENGGRDNGEPGLRAGYGPNYYAAFVIDPDGHPIEAVFNAPV